MQQFFEGNLVNIQARTIQASRICLENGIIVSIEPLETSNELPYIVPGFIDAHVHIESSLLIPSEFATLAVQHGTVATISDPHEIANVCGVQGVQFMVDNGKASGFNFFFGVPSCVPATTYETAGAELDSQQVEQLLNNPDLVYLAEMMNFPGVWLNDEEVHKKLNAAIKAGKPIDGHAPGLRGSQMKQYFYANATSEDAPIISTDHECFTYEEALEKLEAGVKILIREGSAAKNFDALISLLPKWYQQIMFCSDDKHPDSFDNGHINQLCARAVQQGYNVFEVLTAACINPIQHYRLPMGEIIVGSVGNFCLVNNLQEFGVIATVVQGKLVFDSGTVNLPKVVCEPINNFSIAPIGLHELQFETHEVAINSHQEVLAIKAIDAQLITERTWLKPVFSDNYLQSNTETDCLKMIVVNRYKAAPIAKAFIHNTGLKTGAIASSVAHDSHNIIAIGVDDESLLQVVNQVINCKGGLAVAYNQQVEILPLPVAGLMSNLPAQEVTNSYKHLDSLAKNQLGSSLQSPFMTLSFMALLVIPSLKLSDKGLFDGDTFSFIQPNNS